MQSRSQRFWHGVRRGAKFGAIVAAVIWLIVCCICAVFLTIIPELREKFLAEVQEERALSIIGSSLGSFALVMLYGAVPGAIIMGFAGMLRANQGSTPDSNRSITRVSLEDPS